MTFMFSVRYSFSYYCGCNLAPVYNLTQLILGFGRSPKGLFPFCREPSLYEEKSRQCRGRSPTITVVTKTRNPWVGNRPIFGYRWAAEGLTLTLFRAKLPEIHTLFRTLNFITLFRTKDKMNAVRFKAIYWQLQESTVRHSHCFCVLGEQTKFI